MAGEIEEPIRLDFQADSLHSGSISFGRFETEALCWERRSSFRHNRYLEEVEKCAKPGLVTEKKAYFEAHFRKKGVMCMTSSENHNETDYQTNKTDIPDKTGYQEKINHLKTETYSPCFDEKLDGSVHEREHEVIDREKEVFGTSTSETQIDLSCDIVKNGECIPEHGKVEEAHHAKLGSSLSNHSGSGIEMKENLDGETANLDMNNVSDVAFVLLSDSLATKENSSASPKDGQQVSSSEEIFASEGECTKQRLEPPVSVIHSRRCVSSTASKSSEKKPSKAVKIVSLRLKPESTTSEALAQDKCTTNITSKSVLCSKGKGVKETKRGEIESRNRRIAEPQSSTLRKDSSRVYQRTNRVNPAAGTTKLSTKRDKSRSSYKCNERAERKKEAVMKLEAKTHAKEAEMHQLQEKTKEKTETEIKQFRKSLNFKATPLPSFYRGALHESDRNKALASNIEPQKPRSTSSSIGSRVVENSPSSSSAGKNRAMSIRKPPKTADPPQASGGTSCNSTVTSDSIPSSPAAEISKCHGSKSVINTQVSVKKEKDKDKNTGLHQRKVSNGGKKIYKGKTMNGKPQTFTKLS
ncbi:hypothetical protein CDL12_01266 [Handroanthus impetiginosus]|uniref:TPX2 C-terminal domain-containing protein n=1 Tax=Handroanthus impetiginosus TaxID=429701 RepID=A0A2G9I8A1_9LAMI|nr:hypothetical protein CDL12_01266 [Handroanthus impetiginosus]